jgi:hypothetical protein
VKIMSEHVMFPHTSLDNFFLRGYFMLYYER